MDALNARLKAIIPHNEVAYSSKEVVGDPHEIVDRMLSDYRAQLAPPQSVLDHSFGIVRQQRTVAEPESITYLFKMTNIFGFKVCFGWQVVEHPLRGGPPIGDYKAIFPCSPDKYEPYTGPSPKPRNQAPESPAPKA